MRRLLAWAAGAAGGLAAYRLLRWRSQPVLAPPEPEPDPRAAELRAKLDAQAGDKLVQAEAEEEKPEERRARVHERGRAAVDEMRGRDQG